MVMNYSRALRAANSRAGRGEARGSNVVNANASSSSLTCTTENQGRERERKTLGGGKKGGGDESAIDPFLSFYHASRWAENLHRVSDITAPAGLIILRTRARADKR